MSVIKDPSVALHLHHLRRLRITPLPQGAALNRSKKKSFQLIADFAGTDHYGRIAVAFAL